jgi:hypothetical protein
MIQRVKSCAPRFAFSRPNALTTPDTFVNWKLGYRRPSPLSPSDPNSKRNSTRSKRISSPPVASLLTCNSCHSSLRVDLWMYRSSWRWLCWTRKSQRRRQKYQRPS